MLGYECSGTSPKIAVTITEVVQISGFAFSILYLGVDLTDFSLTKTDVA